MKQLKKKRDGDTEQRILDAAHAVFVRRGTAGTRMQEIAAAVREGAQAYLKRQYTTIGIVGVAIFLIVSYFLGWLVAAGFAIGSGSAPCGSRSRAGRAR